jgi:hypothetical protein
MARAEPKLHSSTVPEVIWGSLNVETIQQADLCQMSRAHQTSPFGQQPSPHTDPVVGFNLV